MSASFYDLLKFAKTGIASPSMTAYDKMKALAMCKAGFPVKTISGVPPISFKSDGSALTAWSISGNMTQSGTPTPTVPIQPEECGERTANLFYKKLSGANINANGIITTNGSFDLFIAKVVEGETYSVSGVSGNMAFFVNEPQLNSQSYNGSRESIVSPVTIPQGVNYAAYRTEHDVNTAMLNTGSTALPYEPFGYALPITLAGQTQTIYLPEPLRKIGDYADVVNSDGTVTRRVKKVVLTGQESGEWDKNPSFNNGDGYYNLTAFSGYVRGLSDAICSHLNKIGSTGDPQGIYSGNNISIVFDHALGLDTKQKLRQWLSEQYSNGTPVCVWYVLATATTETVTVPTLTPAKGSNTLSIGTTLAPSSVSITGGIK